MNRLNRSWWLGVAALATLLLLELSSTPCFAQKISLDPDTVKIDMFFRGSQLVVSGQVPRGSDAVIEVIGKDIEEELMRKGHWWELWMNVGEVDLEGVPSLYMVASSDPKLFSPDNVKKSWGYGRLLRRTVFEGRVRKIDDPLIFREFVELRESQGLYGRFPGAVHIAAAGGSRDLARTTFHFTSRIAPGTYRVCLSAVRNGHVVKRACAPWKVVMVGVPAFLTSLAHNRPVLYGLLALAMACAVGALSGLIFKRGAGRKPC